MSKSVFARAIAAFALSSTALSCVALSSSPARATDPLHYWQGPYAGVNLGYQWGSVSNSSTSPSGVAGGAQLGHNWQFGQFVLGGETDIQLADADDRFASWKFSNPWFGTLRARAGFAVNNLLFYGTAGLAYGNLRLENIATGVTESHLSTGWTFGGGIEAVIYDRWTARAEYLYVNLSDSNFVLTGLSHGSESGTLRIGVNYRF